MVRPESEAVTFASKSKTRLFWPPLMVTPAAGPVIVWNPWVSFSSSWLPPSVIVWWVPNTVESKTIVFAWLSALAWVMQYRRSPATFEPLPVVGRVGRQSTVNVGEHDAGLEGLQGRATAQAVVVGRLGGECEPLADSATAGHGCLLLEWDALQCGAMRYGAMRIDVVPGIAARSPDVRPGSWTGRSGAAAIGDECSTIANNDLIGPGPGGLPPQPIGRVAAGPARVSAGCGVTPGLHPQPPERTPLERKTPPPPAVTRPVKR